MVVMSGGVLAGCRHVVARDEENLALGMLGIQPDGLQIGEGGVDEVLIVADFDGEDAAGLEVVARFGEVQEEYEHQGGYALEASAREVLHGDTRVEVCERLLDDARSLSNLGDVALSHWAAIACGVLRVLRADGGGHIGG